MSGLVKWTSRAKHKPRNKAAGNKPNAQRQRMLAARKRKVNEKVAKQEAKARKAAIAAAVAEQ